MRTPSDDPSLPYSTSQINRAGGRIRRAAVRGKPQRASDLELLNEFRALHQPTLEGCQRELVALFHEEAGLDHTELPITGRPLKTVEAITAKLVRSKTRLATMQDIAGTRIVVPTLEIQDLTTTVVLGQFRDRDGKVVKDTRADGDDFGYRGLHVVATLGGRFAEVQIRTRGQDAWAQLVERADKMLGSDLKHGSGPADWLDWLLELSDALRQRDLGKQVPFPPTPHDLLIREEESTE